MITKQRAPCIIVLFQTRAFYFKNYSRCLLLRLCDIRPATLIPNPTPLRHTPAQLKPSEPNEMIFGFCLYTPTTVAENAQIAAKAQKPTNIALVF